ncbi:uncharacterized protein LOC112524888 [Cynara cardunculus var. scolymus]|uniref:Uncharacterized protein n=1 Tax=Cynara cardunculus var. scolymus TaxID=59895 RepID=A0A103Y8N4_CYNCS|nr:uncharacterized protein LOC112524888 [Cynara cardunculus var. scolymus]KVI04534.1 hypothetical protein Ccrd_017146 [Cynara cardunculus var. scolymus]
MSAKPPSPILLLLLLTIAVAVTALPTSVRSNPDLIVLPSSTSLCPHSVNPGSCPIKCFRPAPVCGVDNVTYWCGCSEAICAGVPVAKLGFCDFENGGSGPVSGQALLLVHIVWLILLGFFVLFGLL